MHYLKISVHPNNIQSVRSNRMNTDMNNNFSNLQISTMLYSIVVGIGIINIPKDIAEVAGTGGWFSLLIATLLFILITYIITYLQYVYEGKTIYEYSKLLVGKFLTNVFVSIYFVYFFTFLTMLTRLYSEDIRLILLNKTPDLFICILLLIVIGYALSKGISVIGRLCQIYIPINIVGTILITFLVMTKGKFVNIRPLFSSQDMVTYLKALKTTLFPFLGMEILLFIPITQSKNKNIMRYTMLTVGLIGIIYIYIVEAVIAVIGVESVIYLNASVLFALKGIDIYNLDIIRRLDGFYIIIWSMNLVCAMSLWSYGIISILTRKIKHTNYNLNVLIIFCMSFIVSQIPKTFDGVKLIMKYNSYLGTVTAFIIPFILFIITKVKKYDKQI